MKRKLCALAILFAIGMGVVIIQGCKRNSTPQTGAPSRETRTTSTTTPATTASSHVPAHYQAPPPSAELRPVLAASQFTGKAREAYEAVSQIPVTIAQLPCYCHCDRGMGHKSLHSCFEDDHAAHCAVCVDEALMAYRLAKEGLSAAQIRERIIAKFGT